MGRVRQDGADGLYERVLQRLSRALAESERAGGGQSELEVSGLTRAELGLIQAWLRQDSQWLSGWHAAAEEQAVISRSGRHWPLRNPARQRRGVRLRPGAASSLQQALNCALCDTEVRWPDGPGPAACPACGSQWLRACQRPGNVTRH